MNQSRRVLVSEITAGAGREPRTARRQMDARTRPPTTPYRFSPPRWNDDRASCQRWNTLSGAVGLRCRPICARRCKKRTAPQRRGRRTRAHTDHYHGTTPRPCTYPRLGAVFRPWFMARARQGHGPRQACPSGDTENGADARTREWPGASWLTGPLMVLDGRIDHFAPGHLRATPRSSAKADHAPPRCRSTPKTRLTDAQDLDIALGNVFKSIYIEQQRAEPLKVKISIGTW